MFWAALTDVIPADSLPIGAGLLGGSLNLGAAFLPTLLAVSPPPTTLLVLAALSASGALAIALAARCSGDPSERATSDAASAIAAEEPSSTED